MHLFLVLKSYCFCHVKKLQASLLSLLAEYELGSSVAATKDSTRVEINMELLL